jgi:predicted nucleotidyltransferase
VVGGLAVSLRTVERFTKDLDLAVAVDSDTEAEDLVRAFANSGYLIETVIEQDTTDRLSTVRLISRGEVVMFIDLLFASSGIEPEVVSNAEEVEIFSGVSTLVATIPSLIALKVLSANRTTRLQDILDLQHLIKEATAADIDSAGNLLDLITERGFNREKDLPKEFEQYLLDFRPFEN